MSSGMADESKIKAGGRPGDKDLRRMYDIVQADARLANRVEGLGFGRNGDAYRRAAARLKVMELIRVLGQGKRIRNHIVHRPGYVPSEDDYARAMEQYAAANRGISRVLGEKVADVRLRDGKYDDVKRIYEALTDDEKDLVTPGRRVYKDIPSRLAGRTVAYEGRDPVGFCDAWGLYDDGRVRPSPMLCLAVSDKARGRGLASQMSGEVLGKVLKKVKEMRKSRGKDADRLKRFVWRLRKDNDASARAAAKSGFTEQFFPKPHSYRQFVMSREEAERMAR